METYADWLRGRGDDELHALLSARPELLAPVPADLTALAARAATPAAISRALDRLDRFTLAVLEALLVVPAPAGPDALADAVGASPEQVAGALGTLRRHGLAWGNGTLCPAPGVRHGLPHPAGLGPPIREAFAGYPAERLADLVTDLQGKEPRGFPDAAALLRRLTPPPGGPRGEDAVVRAAAGEAATTVRLTEELLERWGLEPPPVLRSGGLAVRDLRAAAGFLDVPEWHAALLVEVAYAAGLLTRSGDLDGEWLPTPAYDLWLMRDTAGRWTELARGWLKSDRVAGLAGERDDRDRLINALSEAMVRSSAPSIRRAVLEILADAGPGAAVAEDALRARLAWLRPRRGGPARDRLVGWTLREAAALGVTGFGGLAPFARDLLAGDDPEPRLEKHLPDPVDEIVIQADLTAIAPGPLVTDLARELALAADVESTGGATVYRFTAESIRRALDAGRTAADVTELLTRHSATPLPQPLVYLIEDVARRHGHLRVGALSSYVRTDSPATLDEILADRRSEALRLHRLAPTVLASALQRTDLLDGLRAMGLAPVAEAPGGGVIVTRPDAQRADPPPTAEIVRVRPEERTDAAMISAAVRALRAGDEASAHGAEQARLRAADALSGAPPRSPALATIERLREAVERGGRVWIGYLDQQGQASSRIVEPVRVEGGFLTGYDATRAAVHRFALHRITGVSEIADDPAP